MVRIADVNDTNPITELCTQLGYKTSKEEVEMRLKKALEDDCNEVYVAEVDGKILGWLQVAVKQTIESGEYAEITGLVVDKTSRGKGIGRDLVTQAEDWAKEMKQSTIRVRTNVIRKEAPLFYRALGFKEIKKQSVFNKPL
jgi:N-acetylglutamate synthase-like GNAT family acetyltransferase